MHVCNRLNFPLTLFAKHECTYGLNRLSRAFQAHYPVPARLAWYQNHQAPMLEKSKYIPVSVDARKAFNTFSRQKILCELLFHAISLSRFIKIGYEYVQPHSVLQCTPRVFLIRK